MGEEICRSRVHGQERWVKKQRSIVSRKTASWFNRPVKVAELIAASKPKSLSPEAAQRVREALKRYRESQSAAQIRAM